MKVFFDTNVYVAEALLGKTAQALVDVTEEAGWRISVSTYLLDELQSVLFEKLHFSKRLAFLSRRRVFRRAELVEPPTSRHEVPQDPKDSPILRAALTAGADYLITNDAHLLDLDPYEGLRIVSLAACRELLVHEGLIKADAS